MSSVKDYDVRHFLMTPPWAESEGWIFLESGSDPTDSRGLGGAYYYRGNRENALAEVAKYKAEQRARSDRYYAQLWV